MDRSIDINTLTDQQLLEGLRQNDQEIWRLVYNNNRRPIVNYLRSQGAPADIAREIFQDTMIFLDQRKERLNLTSKLSVYLIGVAWNKFREYNRKTKAETNTRDDFDLYRLGRRTDNESDEAEQILQQSEIEDGQQFDLDGIEVDAMVQQMLDQIPFKHCVDIFRLRYWYGLDNKQIASRLNLAHGTIRNQIISCKKQAKLILLQMGWG